MKQSKVSLLVLGLLSFVLLLPEKSSALLFLSEQFAGYSDGRLGDTGTGGGGTIPGWNTPRDGITLTNADGSLVGTSLGLVISLGTRVSITTSNLATPLSAGGGSYNRFVQGGTFPPSVETNIYTSFLYRFNNAAEVSSSGQFISAMNRQNSGWNNSEAQNTFSWFLVARSSGGNIQLGLTRWNSGTGTYAETNYASVNIAAGQTFFVVIRQHVIPPASTPDQIDLWINPAPSTFGLGEASIPVSDATNNVGTDDTSSTGPGRFWVVSSGASASIDEIRIANNWAEATPSMNSCGTAGIASDPASVTQVEGINSTFRVVANSGSTGPSYQWQRSTNSGTTWNNISGAISSSYTTPNLWISNGDNGSQYRAIVHVSCDNSSVTSAVATVTLSTPTFAPIGLLMDDTFLDPDSAFDSRQNTPLTSSNSLWYTWVPGETDEPTSLLNAFGQGGNMVGTPRSASSSLWLGYFVSNNAVVSLDVGKAIKVTMPFTPNSFSSHTNNGALRFGVFDYFDAGTNITSDASDLTGSGGRGTGVRGYMFSVDFGTAFSANSPLSLLVRSGISDPNLMGTTSDYTSMGSGPSGGGYSNAPAFQGGTEYTIELTVSRTSLSSVSVAANITGGGTNWSFTATDTNFAYYRFDTFAIRPNSLETAADSFNFSEFKVEVIQGIVTVNPFNITGIQMLSPGSVKLTWASQSGINYNVLSKDTLTASGWVTNATVMATGPSTSYTNSTTASSRFYRIQGTP